MSTSTTAPTGPALKLKTALLNLFCLWDIPIACFFLALLGYMLLSTAKGGPLRASDMPYYNYLADAFLHGQTYLRLVPLKPHDLSLFQGQYYLYWGALPALLFVPFVAIFGAGFWDMLAVNLIGALNVTLVLLLLKAGEGRGLFQLTRVQRTLLVLFFAFGSVHTALAAMGGIYFTAQVTGFAGLALAYWAVLKFNGGRAFWLAGLGIALAFLSRSTMILVALWPAWYLLRGIWRLPLKQRFGLALRAGAPVLVAGLFFLAYNGARFGSLLETGIGYQLMGDYFGPIYRQYGFFNLAFLPTNLYYQFLFYPIPWRLESYMGGSLFLLSPVYFGLFFSLWMRRRELSTWMLLATLVIAYLPIGLCMGTGYGQVGPRYLSDLAAPLLLLTAPGISKWPTWVLAGLTLISIFSFVTSVIVY